MKKCWIAAVLLLLVILMMPSPVSAQSIPGISFNLQQTDNPEKVVSTLQIVGLLTVLALAPMLVLMMTSFTRLIIVFHFLRQAIGAAQVPPAQLVVGLALILTFYIMSPTLNVINEAALQPYLQGKMDQKTALAEAVKPLKTFMLAQVRERDLALFVNMSKTERPSNPSDIGLAVLVPAYVISELRIAFQIGFVIYLPFLIIDMVVSSVLLAMGMMMLPPVMVSLPFKILLFVMVDGWYLIVESMVKSFH
jgi:flagellar biosynthetic protein FliP